MAISTDAEIEFYGTQDTLGSTTSAVADAAFSAGTSDITAWTNDDDAITASVVLEGNYTSAPTANTVVNLFMRKLNIDDGGAEDEPVPDANNRHSYAGTFFLNDATGAFTLGIDIALPNNRTSQIYEPYIENMAGQSLPAGWDLHITPKARGPHP